MIMNEKNVVRYVSNNPGLTATMIGKLTRRRYGTASAILFRLAQAGKIIRVEAMGERGGISKAWRYYPIGLKQARNVEIPRLIT